MLTIPFNPKTASKTDDSFAPIYDVEFLKFAIKVNRFVMVGLGVVALLLIVPAVIFLGNIAPESTGSGLLSDKVWKMFLEFVAPIFLTLLGIIIVVTTTQRLGFPVSKAYYDTELAFKVWLAGRAGDLDGTPENEVHDLMLEIITGEPNLSSLSLSETAKAVAQGRPETQLILNREGQPSELRPTKDGAYQLA